MSSRVDGQLTSFKLGKVDEFNALSPCLVQVSAFAENIPIPFGILPIEKEKKLPLIPKK